MKLLRWYHYKDAQRRAIRILYIHSLAISRAMERTKDILRKFGFYDAAERWDRKAELDHIFREHMWG